MRPSRSGEMHEHYPRARVDKWNRRPPRHVAIVLDGNGRWAQRQGLPRTKGHEAGTENIRAIVSVALDLGIEYLTFYAFSTENWRRPATEVQGIFRILTARIAHYTEELDRSGIRFHHIGDLTGLDPRAAHAIQAAIQRTAGNRRMTLTFAFNYGGRAELVRAIRAILRENPDPEIVDEAMVARYLYTVGMPDPDLIIRPSGEQRLSNFLLWQGAYADLAFPPTLWPDFRADDLRTAIAEYQRRHRAHDDWIADRATHDPDPLADADVTVAVPRPQQDRSEPQAAHEQ